MVKIPSSRKHPLDKPIFSTYIRFMYKQATVYFTSGTGNSFRAAAWFAEEAKARGLSTRVIPLDAARPAEEIGRDQNELVGIVTPTHGFIAPWNVLKFAFALPRRPGVPAFALATQGCMKVGPVFIPGLSASATFIVALLMFLRGFSVRGVFSLDMPVNWIALHSGLKPSNVEAIIARARPRLAAFAARVLAGNPYWWTAGNVITFLLGLLLLPISLLYMAMGRFFLAKIFFANPKCNGCEICARNCPVGAIIMRGKKNPRPFWTYKCESCMRCMGFCPEKAVEAGHSWAALLIYLTMLPFAFYFLKWLGGYIPGVRSLDNPLGQNLLQLIYTYLSLFLSYYLFFALIRVPLINKLFTYTTLTHLYRRYHEPGTRLKDLNPEKNK